MAKQDKAAAAPEPVKSRQADRAAKPVSPPAPPLGKDIKAGRPSEVIIEKRGTVIEPVNEWPKPKPQPKDSGDKASGKP